MKETIYLPLNQPVIEIDKLVPYEKNPRKHSKEGIAELSKAIREFGFTAPIIVDQHYRIIAGHGRRLAALELKMKKVTYVLVHCEEDQYLKLVMSDNKLAELSKWDKKLSAEVAEILQEMNEADLSIPGFSNEDIDKIFGHAYKETLQTVADFGDSGEVDVMDEKTRVTSMTFKMTVHHHKKIKSTIGAIMRENDFETIGDALVYMCSKFTGPTKTVRRNA